MSSPADTVDQVFAWLKRVFAIALPTLPLAGVYRRFTALFDLTISTPLPAPTDPLPWTIAVADDWASPIPGITVSLDQIRIRVDEKTLGSPAGEPPQGARAQIRKPRSDPAARALRGRRSGRRLSGRRLRPFDFTDRP